MYFCRCHTGAHACFSGCPEIRKESLGRSIFQAYFRPTTCNKAAVLAGPITDSPLYCAVAHFLFLTT